ncbi:MAG: DUF4097 domain-containing protein [Acidobacteriota bacterium]|nr:DUF4097 domain-containing protein [Acidobacteriota bacterium]
MISILPLMLAALIAGQAAPPAEPSQALAFDQTVPAARGTRISVKNPAGEIIMRTWDRDAVRVTARHNARARVGLRTADNTIWVAGGGMGAIDYDITVPSWMPVKVSGHYNYIELNGMGSEVSAENVRGDIDIKGGRGFITATSIEGRIAISGTQGKVTATTVNEHLTVDNATGELSVESTNGNITLTAIKSSAVRVSALNGTVRYSGPLADQGRYGFVTHNGSIRLEIQQNPNATFYVRTYGGSFHHGGVNLKPQGEARRGRRNTFVGGTGSAQVEVESFQGSVRVFTAGGQ